MILLHTLKGHWIGHGSAVWTSPQTRSISFLATVTILAYIFGNTTLHEKQVLESKSRTSVNRIGIPLWTLDNQLIYNEWDALGVRTLLTGNSITPIVRKPCAPATRLIHRVPVVSSSFRVCLAGAVTHTLTWNRSNALPNHSPISMTCGTLHYLTTNAGWPLFQVSNEKMMPFMWWAFQTHPSATSSTRGTRPFTHSGTQPKTPSFTLIQMGTASLQHRFQT